MKADLRFPVLAATLAASLFAALPARSDAPIRRPLSFEDRVAAQEAIERVYYAHQIGATEPFETAVPRASFERKVRTYLEQSLMLERFWKTPITAEALRREAERITDHTQAPDRLRELYAALHDDPFLIQETLARQTLAGRLAQNFFATDERIHASRRAEAEHLRARLVGGAAGAGVPVPERVNVTVGPMEAASALVLDRDAFDALRRQLPARPGDITEIAEQREAFVVRRLVAAGRDSLSFDVYTVPKTTWEEWVAASGWDDEDIGPVADSAALPLPVPSSASSACRPADSWAPRGGGEEPTPRVQHTAVWTGTEMLIWGGYGPDGVDQATGGRYDPLTDVWRPISTVNAPTAQRGHTAAWTGSEMIVVIGTSFGTSGRYNPITDTWRPVSQAGAPASLRSFGGAWTGAQLFTPTALYNPFSDAWTAVAGSPFVLGDTTVSVWTGRYVLTVFGRPDSSTLLLARYDPAANEWTNLGVPATIEPRGSFTAVWTGNRMIVWGGLRGTNPSSLQALNTGGIYDPVKNSWTPTSTTGAPAGRSEHSAVWSGSRMIVWGGTGAVSPTSTGGAYDPATNSWVATGTTNAPLPRDLHTAVWTGSLMVIWGGVLRHSTPEAFQTTLGGRYDPAADAWTATSTHAAPSPRFEHTGVWTGSQMIVWGGSAGDGRTNTGGKYDPILDSWTATPTQNAPAARSRHVAVWTGSRMIVWGGLNAGGASLGDGGRYDPVANTWAGMATLLSPRDWASAVWTGTRMIVWGGEFNGGTRADGALYDPGGDAWSATAASPLAGRVLHAAVWTGTQMAIWSGLNNPPPFVGPALSDGALYTPATNTWSVMRPQGAPPGAASPSAVWNGTEVLIWPGSGTAGGLGVARYNPATNIWTDGTVTGAPGSAGVGGSYGAVWSGTEMILWGDVPPGVRYNAALDVWSPLTSTGAPGRRRSHTMLWTGSEVIVWGGQVDATPILNGLLNDSARYAPAQLDADADGDGYTACGGDCDDHNPAVHPGAAEICNGIDDDCDGIRDNGFTDADGDGWAACGGDCNDANPAVHPGAIEMCNGIDDNCVNGIDEGFDRDGDGFTLCGGDCNDTDPAVHPGAVEICNGVDDDCDGIRDNGFTDADHDGWAVCAGDCDDTNPAVHPGAVEVCNGLDDNCDGAIDEGTLVSCQDSSPCTTDACGGVLGCTHQPVANGTACVIPGGCFTGSTCSAGVCQGGTARDADQDTHVDPACGGDDCNDNDATVWHAPFEVANVTVSGSSPTTLAWDSQAASAGPETSYDVVSGLVGSSGAGYADALCLSEYGADPTFEDSQIDPPVGYFNWYLVRGRNSCAVGGYGSSSDGVPRSIAACP